LAWKINYSDKALRQIRKLDKQTAKRILENMEKIVELDDVRSLGHALAGPLGTLWRYRVGDYRVICDIQDMIVRILVVEVGHRSDIYR
jgi:mRNA interferase RelE/StbE